jgi:hypothetical protein
MESEIRVVFHATVDTVRPLLAERRLRERWETPSALELAVEILMEVARIRHGGLAVVRALARRERDAVQALRVL